MDEFRVLLKATFQSFPNTDEGLYQRLVNQFGGWVLKPLRQYSNSLLSHIIFAPFAVDDNVQRPFSNLNTLVKVVRPVDEWKKLYDTDKKALRLLDCCDIFCGIVCEPLQSAGFFLADGRRRLYGALYICNVMGKRRPKLLGELAKLYGIPIDLVATPPLSYNVIFQENAREKQQQVYATETLQKLLSKSSLQWRAKLRYGFWNRRGDYLTEDGNMLHAPDKMAYPLELQNHPAEITS